MDWRPSPGRYGICLEKAGFPSSDVIIEEVCKFYNIENDALRNQGRTGTPPSPAR